MAHTNLDNKHCLQAQDNTPSYTMAQTPIKKARRQRTLNYKAANDADITVQLAELLKGPFMRKLAVGGWNYSSDDCCMYSRVTSCQRVIPKTQYYICYKAQLTYGTNI